MPRMNHYAQLLIDTSVMDQCYDLSRIFVGNDTSHIFVRDVRRRITALSHWLIDMCDMNQFVWGVLIHMTCMTYWFIWLVWLIDIQHYKTNKWVVWHVFVCALKAAFHHSLCLSVCTYTWVILKVWMRETTRMNQWALHLFIRVIP